LSGKLRWHSSSSERISLVQPPGAQRDAQSQRAELAVQLSQLLGEEAEPISAARRLQARKARIC
jgi:hypothetical protein